MLNNRVGGDVLGRYIREGLGDGCVLYSDRRDTAVVACRERHSCCSIGVGVGEKRSKMYRASTALMADSGRAIEDGDDFVYPRVSRGDPPE